MRNIWGLDVRNEAYSFIAGKTLVPALFWITMTWTNANLRRLYCPIGQYVIVNAEIKMPAALAPHRIYI